MFYKSMIRKTIKINKIIIKLESIKYFKWKRLIERCRPQLRGPSATEQLSSNWDKDGRQRRRRRPCLLAFTTSEIKVGFTAPWIPKKATKLHHAILQATHDPALPQTCQLIIIPDGEPFFWFISAFFHLIVIASSICKSHWNDPDRSWICYVQLASNMQMRPSVPPIRMQMSPNGPFRRCQQQQQQQQQSQLLNINHLQSNSINWPIENFIGKLPINLQAAALPLFLNGSNTWAIN